MSDTASANTTNPVRRLTQFRLRTLLALVTVVAITAWWIDTPRRTTLEFRKHLANGNLAAANALLDTGYEVRSSEGFTNFHSDNIDVAYGTRTSWRTTPIYFDPISVLDLVRRSRSVSFDGIAPREDDLIFEIHGSKIRPVIVHHWF